MNKNTQVETAPKSQATNKDKTPVGKVKSIKTAEQRRKEREENYRNFRINSLRRRCERYGFDKEKTEKLVKKLIEQMDSPKEYFILIFISPKNFKMMNEALKNASIKYKYCGPTFFSIDGNQDVLAKLREIVPEDSTIHPYAKKMESVIPEEDRKKKAHTNNTDEKRADAKKKRKNFNKKVRAVHKKHTLSYKKKKTLKASKKKSGTTVQMVNKKPSESLKKASTGLKKAA